MYVGIAEYQLVRLHGKRSFLIGKNQNNIALLYLLAGNEYVIYVELKRV